MKVSKEPIVTLGPMTSSWGLKMWRLILRRGEILAWPYGFKDGLRLGLMLELGIGRDPGDFSSKTMDEIRSALEEPSVRKFPVAGIDHITLRCSSLRHKIEIVAKDGSTEKFGLWHRHLLTEYGIVLRKMYPDRYRETGFPTKLWDRITKL
ncbi:MAG: hypothetical protein NTW74_13475 [Acidobacteria bacterium]|nr:hypothetical protein [Acidobacteriota bacterium]